MELHQRFNVVNISIVLATDSTRLRVYYKSSEELIYFKDKTGIRRLVTERLYITVIFC